MLSKHRSLHALMHENVYNGWILKKGLDCWQKLHGLRMGYGPLVGLELYGSLHHSQKPLAAIPTELFC